MKTKNNLPIFIYGQDVLRKSSFKVENIDNSIKYLIEKMKETMYNNSGVGLAAPQIGKNLNIFIIDVSSKKNDLKVFINPKILRLEGKAVGEEGCLSIPGIYAEIPRAEFVKVEAQDIKGKKFKLEAEGLLAVAIQHENDHLEGKLFIDYLDKLQQLKIKSKLDKLKCDAKLNT